jgi:hypothetical protein
MGRNLAHHQATLLSRRPDSCPNFDRQFILVHELHVKLKHVSSPFKSFLLSFLSYAYITS